MSQPQIFVYDSNDGDIQVFSSFEHAWEYAQAQDWTNAKPVDPETWSLSSNGVGVEGKIMIRILDQPF